VESAVRLGVHVTSCFVAERQYAAALVPLNVVPTPPLPAAEVELLHVVPPHCTVLAFQGLVCCLLCSMRVVVCLPGDIQVRLVLGSLLSSTVQRVVLSRLIFTQQPPVWCRGVCFSQVTPYMLRLVRAPPSISHVVCALVACACAANCFVGDLTLVWHD